jgi:hypothetical protein
MADATYDISDLIDKTFYAAVPMAVYKDASDSAAPVYTVAVGQPIGVLYSWLDPSASENRSELWFMFWPDGQDPYYTKYGPGYNFDALIGQGLQSDAQKAAAAATAALPWYEQLITKYGPYILGTILVGAAVKGYLARPRKQ